MPWDHNTYIVKNRPDLLFLDVINNQERPDVIGLRDDKDRNEIKEGDVQDERGGTELGVGAKRDDD